MDFKEAFSIWVPDLPDDAAGPPWTAWSKPVLFATGSPVTVPTEQVLVEPPPVELELDSPFGSKAVVVDLPGLRSIAVGLALAERGFRPVPLFNGCPGPGELINTAELQIGLLDGARLLKRLRFTSDAPPVFLLDSRRMSREVVPAPGRFDNRWFTFPQDFPSANLLLARGVQSILLVQHDMQPPAEDLAHVLKRWQEAGLEILQTTSGLRQNEPLQVKKPRRYRNLWYGLLALLGLYPNSAGGFGGVIPQPSSG